MGNCTVHRVVAARVRLGDIGEAHHPPHSKSGGERGDQSPDVSRYPLTDVFVRIILPLPLGCAV